MTPSDDTNSLKEALTECARLKEENRRLKALLGIQEKGNPLQSKTTAITNDSPADAKIALFRSLFRGRDDVYPVRWEGKNGKSGNSSHVWIFFDVPILAALARKLGSAILTHTTDRRHQVGFDSYDRFARKRRPLTKNSSISTDVTGLETKNP